MVVARVGGLWCRLSCAPSSHVAALSHRYPNSGVVLEARPPALRGRPPASTLQSPPIHLWHCLSRFWLRCFCSSQLSAAEADPWSAVAGAARFCGTQVRVQVQVVQLRHVTVRHVQRCAETSWASRVDTDEETGRPALAKEVGANEDGAKEGGAKGALQGAGPALKGGGMLNGWSVKGGGGYGCE